ncbi:MAG: hypothetical protein L3J11_04890 [Draconibacterium sp.]|nr:hypothetical protein [Draconibacterium sp.]
MLKKLSHIILSILLLATTMGVAISKHYCGGSLMSVSLSPEDEPCCDMAGCCHNETSFYQLKEDFSASQVVNTPPLASLDLMFADVFLLLNEWQTENEPVCTITFNDPLPKNIQTALSLKQSYLL